VNITYHGVLGHTIILFSKVFFAIASSFSQFTKAVSGAIKDLCHCTCVHVMHGDRHTISFGSTLFSPPKTKCCRIRAPKAHKGSMRAGYYIYFFISN
jgi:hypothetical protein